MTEWGIRSGIFTLQNTNSLTVVGAGWITAGHLQELGGIGHQDFGRQEVPSEQIEEQPAPHLTLPADQKGLWAPWDKTIPALSSSN